MCMQVQSPARWCIKNTSILWQSGFIMRKIVFYSFNVLDFQISLLMNYYIYHINKQKTNWNLSYISTFNTGCKKKDTDPFTTLISYTRQRLSFSSRGLYFCSHFILYSYIIFLKRNDLYRFWKITISNLKYLEISI